MLDRIYREYANVDEARIPVIIGTFVLLSAITFCAYSLFFHPLRKFPGPWKAAITPVWITKTWMSGRYPHVIKSLHDKYGPAVRTGPNEVSFSTATAWKTIHGHKPKAQEFLKSDWYSQVEGVPDNVLTAQDPLVAAHMRRLLSSGVSARALAQQEESVHKYADMLVHQLNRHSTENPDNWVKWYNYCTFDVFGDFAFGEAFGSLKSGKPHFWVQLMFANIKTGALLRAVRYFPHFMQGLLDWAMRITILPRSITEPRRKHASYSRETLSRRIESEIEEHSFLVKIIDEHKSGKLSFAELLSQASLLIIAGSETVSTALSGTTFYLCRNPTKMRKLAEELRSSITAYEDINGRTTEALPYLKAVIDEGLRIYPPAPIGMPRVSPGEMVDGYWVPKGTITYVTSLAAARSPDNFHRPEAFIPERWLDPTNTDQKQASQPFGMGSRVCLGRVLALVELRVILAKIFWTFDIRIVNDDVQDWVEESDCFMLWQKPELPILASRRPGVRVPPIDDDKEESLVPL